METGRGKPAYVCPRCNESYEGEIHACRSEISQPIQLSETDVGTTPTLPQTPTARHAAAQHKEDLARDGEPERVHPADISVRHDALIGEIVAGRYKILRKMGE